MARTVITVRANTIARSGEGVKPVESRSSAIEGHRTEKLYENG